MSLKHAQILLQLDSGEIQGKLLLFVSLKHARILLQLHSGESSDVQIFIIRKKSNIQKFLNL